MAADGDRNSEAVQSSSVTHQVQHGNEPLSCGDMYTTALSSIAKAPSPALLGQTLVSLSRLTAKRRSQSADCSGSLRSRICEREEIIEEGSSSATQFERKYALLPPLASAKRLCVLSEHLALMRDGLHQGATPILADHNAITPFKRIDLMLLSNNHRFVSEKWKSRYCVMLYFVRKFRDVIMHSQFDNSILSIYMVKSFRARLSLAEIVTDVPSCDAAGK